jgi:K+-sensing histidine kinase KdpD
MFDTQANSTNQPGNNNPGFGPGGKSKGSPDVSLTNCPEILTGLSREMRSHLNAIVSFSYLINSNNYDPTEKEDFSNQIYESCKTMITMFDNFLDSTIIELGNSKIEPESVNFGEMFNELFSEFRETLKKSRTRDLVLVTESQPYISDRYLTDANRLGKIIRNLFQNAVSNTKSGYIKAGYLISDETLTFYFLDSGNGFEKNLEFLETQDPVASISRFNDPFSAINILFTRKLINMLDGSVWIERNGLSGSGIYFSIPLVAIVRSNYKGNRLTDTRITI